MKILIAIKSCHHYQARANAQRQTWIKDIPADVDYMFFVGRAKNPKPPMPDVTFLDVEDNYYGLPDKMRKACAWALERGYDYVFFCDDDTYVVVDRLLAAIPKGKDYVGRLRGPSGNWPAPYCSGFAYWLSAKALKIVAETKLSLDSADDRHIGNTLRVAGVPGSLDLRYVVSRCDQTATAGKKGETDPFEDRTVGNTLLDAGLAPEPDYRYAIIKSMRNSLSAWTEPGPNNDLIAVCEFEPHQMIVLHDRVKNAMQVQPTASNKKTPSGRVAVMVKTFLRDGPLFAALDGIQKNLPDCKIVVVDDGIERKEKVTRYAKLREQGHVAIWLPFDTGFSKKANAAIPHCNREFVLIGSDDFDFNNPSVKDDVARMIKVLDHDSRVGMVAGRVNNNPYEWQWDWPGEDWIKEVNRDAGGGNADGVAYKYCDLTVNYGLVRRSVLDRVPWDDTDIKIGGGEHAAWFIDLKRAGWKAAYAEGCNINETKIRMLVDSRYQAMRGRAKLPGRPLLKVRGINRYTMGSGVTELS
jgi:hypothetical protein